MATKRQAPTDDHAVAPPRPKRPRPSNPNKPSNLTGKKSFKKAHPVNDLKSQIRSLKRLLERESFLPANVRIEKERALQTARQALQDAEQAQRRSATIGRWHKVRFFDRQKAERRLRKARRKLEEASREGGCDGAEEASLRSAVEECEVDVNYATFYPLDRDYVPLFPTRREHPHRRDETARPEQARDGSEEKRGDREMWETVRDCMKEGTLKDLREGRLAATEAGENAGEPAAGGKGGQAAKKAGKAQGKGEGGDEGSDDEDGAAFFGDD